MNRVVVALALLGSILFVACDSRAAEDSAVVAAGDWSQPVADRLNCALRGRLLLVERARGDRREVAVYIELQDVSEAVGREIAVYCDLGKTDFRPEYTGGLNVELRDAQDKVVPNTPFPFGGAVPTSRWVVLPTDSTIRLRTSPFGLWKPDDGSLTLWPSPGSSWRIAAKDPKDYFLSGTFVVDSPADRPAPTDDHVWTGVIKLPPLKVSTRRP